MYVLSCIVRETSVLVKYPYVFPGFAVNRSLLISIDKPHMSFVNLPANDLPHACPGDTTLAKSARFWAISDTRGAALYVRAPARVAIPNALPLL